YKNSPDRKKTIINTITFLQLPIQFGRRKNTQKQIQRQKMGCKKLHPILFFILTLLQFIDNLMP
ncbi:MAG: hypothetical protein II244_08015, partial [Clostridia bacterium]|nr:hypothetical protein [Clostridia bacterium]